MKTIKSAVLGLFGIIGVMVSMFGIRIPFAESLAKEHWRAGLATLLIVILMVPAAIALFLFLIDANRFKTEIIQYVKVQTQRDLALQGNLKVTFFPEFGLEADKMSLSQRNSAREFASINSARFHVAWWPLLQKRLVIKRAEFDGVRANLVRSRDGSTNFDDLLLHNPGQSPVTLDIEELRIANSSFSWNDEVSWKRIALQDANIETGRLADTVPTQFKARFHLNSEKLHSDTDVQLESNLFYDRQAGRLELADITGRLSGTISSFSNLDMGFTSSLDVRNLGKTPGAATLQADNVIVSGTGNYGQRGIELKLTLPRLQYAKMALNANQLALDIALSQFGEKWSANVNVPAIGYEGQSLKVTDISSDFAFSGESRSLQGRFAGTADFGFSDTPRLQLAASSLDISVRHPMLAGEFPLKAAGSLDADFSSRNIKLGLKGRLGDSEIAGTLSVMDYSHPVTSFDLNVRHLDLDRLVSADWISRYRDDSTVLDFGAIRGQALNGHLRIGELKAAGFKVTSVGLDMGIGQNAMTLAMTGARLYGGSWSGSLSVSTGEQQFALKQNLKGVRMDALLADTAGAGRLSGKTDAVLELNAAGATVGALRKSLNGTVSLSLSRGTLAGMDLRNALLEGKEMLGSNGAPLKHGYMPAEHTNFASLDSVFNFRDGAIQGISFELKSPLFRVAGEGSVANENGNIDYRLDATVASTINRRADSELAGMKGVTVPIHVSGPYAAPLVEMDFAAASGDLVKKYAEDRAASKAAARQSEQPVTIKASPRKKAAKK